MTPPPLRVFLFHRDLRVKDNLALNRFLKDSRDNSARNMFLFVFDVAQAWASRNPYFSAPAFSFMKECLVDLDKQLRENLTVLEGPLVQTVRSLNERYGIEALYFNQDYTPYAIERTRALAKELGEDRVIAVEGDYTMVPLNSVCTKTGDPYKVFTPFYRAFLKRDVPAPHTAAGLARVAGAAVHASENKAALLKPEDTGVGALPGGRRHALARLRRPYERYASMRDVPHEDATTKLSAYLKFGCVSVREVFHDLAARYTDAHALPRELVWREFYANIVHNHPRVLRGQVSDRPNSAFDTGGQWWDAARPQKTTQALLERWELGTTGFPIVDAGMREMSQTGYMHNRLRMICASFLVKDLHIDWREGERVFARSLVDYDPASNSGGWQWSAGVGTDAQPWYRVFNPWTQSKKFDPDCKYIKRWVPELDTVPAGDIHKWDATHHKHAGVHPPPCVDHATARKIYLDQVRSAS